MHQNDQKKSQGINQNVAFSPGCLLMNIDATLFAAFRSFYALTVHNACAGFGLTSIFDTHLLDQGFIDTLPQAGFLPAAEIAIHRLPRRQVFWQHAPLAAGAHHIQDRIDNLPHFPRARASHFVHWKKWLEQLPFGILEVGRVGLVEFGHSPILPDHLRNTFLENHSTVVDSIRFLAVDGFDSFTGAQCRALELLANEVGDLLVTFPGEHQSKRPAHRRFEDHLEKLFRNLQPTITSLENQPLLPPDVRHLESSLFEPGEIAIQNPERPFLLATRSPADEAREALRWIKARVVRDDIPLADCAIFTPNPDLYNSFLRASAQEFGVPVHFSQGSSLVSAPAIAALVNLLNLPVQNFISRLLFNVLRSPYFDFGLDAGSIDMLEEISRVAKIIGGKDQWLETWGVLAPIQPEEIELDDERRLPGLPRGEQAQALKQALESCFELLAPPPENRPRTLWVSWLEDLIERLGFYQRAIYDRDEIACESLRETLRAFVLSETVLGQNSSNFQAFVSSLQNTLNGLALPEPRLKGKPALLIGQMGEARGVRFRAVALLGFSEGIFPEVERPDPFLPELLRQKLGLQSRLDREQAGLFYQALTRADQYLLVTRPYLTDSGEEWEASPYWKELEKRFDATALKVIRPDDIPSLDEAASSQELLFWTVRHRKLPARFLELETRWENLRHARDVLHCRRAKQPGGVYEGCSPGLSRHIADRYSPDTVWSVSRLEAYGKCPHQFYVRSALGLEPRTPPEVGWSVVQMGSMLHQILEETYSHAADPGDMESVLAILPEMAEKVFEKAPQVYGFRESPLWEYEKSQFLSLLQHTIEELEGQSAGWRPIAFEQKFGIYDIPPLVVDLGSETIVLRGVIDRVDRNEAGEIRIVDYKSGSSHQDRRDLENGLSLQLPLYALAVQDTLHLGIVAEGLYWQIQGAKAGQLKLSGFKTDHGQGVNAAIQVMATHLGKFLAGIRAGEFPPVPPKAGCTPYCPAVQWCWRYQPGWGGAK
jgi:ATP-dependent helicase/nuclease subunit B